MEEKKNNEHNGEVPLLCPFSLDFGVLRFLSRLDGWLEVHDIQSGRVPNTKVR